MQGMQMGGQWAQTWEQRRLTAERNKIVDAQNQRREAREERKLGLYAQSVQANAELARARAQKALSGGRGGGAGGGGAGSADADAIRAEARSRGIYSADTSPAPTGN